MDKQYTTDWLTPFLPIWDKLLTPLEDGGNVLEVGTYEGRAACHLLYAYPDIHIDVIDNFVDTYNEGFEARFDSNIAEYEGRFTKIIGDSKTELPRLLAEGKKYKFIYIDGDHSYEGVKPDLETCWELLEPGGLLFLDDYNDHLRDNPFKFGVDSAVNEFFLGRTDFKVESNVHTDYQFYVRKSND